MQKCAECDREAIFTVEYGYSNILSCPFHLTRVVDFVLGTRKVASVSPLKARF